MKFAIGKESGPCFFGQYTNDHQYFNLMTGRKVSKQTLNVPDEVTVYILSCMNIKSIRPKQTIECFRLHEISK